MQRVRAQAHASKRAPLLAAPRPALTSAPPPPSLPPLPASRREMGDLGMVAEKSRSQQKTLMMAAPPPPLTVRAIFAAFKAVAAEGKHDKKSSIIKKLLVAAKGTEARYIVRGMQGKLRIGLAELTAQVALAHAVTLTAAVPPGATADAEEGAGAGAGAGASALLFGPPERGDLPPVLLAPRGCGGTGKVLSPSGWEALEGRLNESSEALKAVFSELPSYDAIVPHLLREGIAGAARSCHLTPGIPVTPMLAKPTKGVAEILDRLEGKPFTCEFKYDGERAQVHVLPGGKVRIFSRNSEETTSRFPDLAVTLQAAMGLVPIAAAIAGAGAGAGTGAGAGAGAGASAAGDAAGDAAGASGAAADDGPPPVSSCVLDGEAVAYDRATGRLLPFQVLSTRSRKDATLDSIKVQVIYIAFDLLYLNGESLLHKSLAERRAALRGAFRRVPDRFDFAVSREGTDTEEIGAFLTEAVKGGCEGLMVKTLEGADSVYEPSKRSLNWLKLKKDYMDGLADSLDLVPVGAYHGTGKRTGVYGAYLLACYDEESGEYQTVCKVGTGFSEEALESLTQSLSARNCTRDAQPKNVIVGDALAKDVDVWFVPEESEVWEIRAADLSISPVHMAGHGRVHPERGVGLRFPRFLRTRVGEKNPTDATSAAMVVHMFRSQATVKGGDDDDDD
jgi:DNA ligase-1